MTISVEQLAQCQEMRLKLTPWKECAAALGVNTEALRNKMYRHGLGSSGRYGQPEFITLESLEQAAQLRKEGHTWAECEEATGVKWRSLKDKMRRFKMLEKGKMGRIPHITADIMERGAQLRKEGLPWEQCGEKLGVNYKSLRSAMGRKGIKAEGKPPRLATPELVARARALRAQGVCWKLVERELGVNFKTLANRVALEDKRERGALEEV